MPRRAASLWNADKPRRRVLQQFHANLSSKGGETVAEQSKFLAVVRTTEGTSASQGPINERKQRIMKSIVQWLAATSTLLSCQLLGTQAHAGGSADSVVKVFSQMRLPNPVRPWIKQNPVEVMGSGVVIERKRILTNAHLVLYADEIFVQGGQGGDRVEAKVVAIGPGIDLAVLTVEDETFFAKRPPIARASKLPEITSRVAVQGFPIGGTSLSTTQGTVARIEYDTLRDRRGGLADPGRRRDQPGQQRWAGRWSTAR